MDSRPATAKPKRRKKKRERGWIVDWEKVEAVARPQGHIVPTDIIAAVRAFDGKGDGLRSTIYNMRRGEGVDENSIRRLSDALGVEWQSLVLRRASKEPIDTQQPSKPQVEDTPEASNPEPNAAIPWLGLSIAAALSVALVVAYLWRDLSDSAPTGLSQVQPATDSAAVEKAPPSVGFYEPLGEGGLALTESLHAALLEQWPVRETLSLRTADMQPSSEVDWTLQFVTRTEERYMIAKLFALTADDRKLVWSDVFPTSAVSTRRSQLGKAAAASLVRYFNGTSTSVAPPDAALTAYARGLIQLDQARNELMVRRIESLFSRALRLAPDWANAMAMLCNVYIQDHYLNNSSESLDAADVQCANALSLEESSTAYLANGSLHRRRGNLDRAEQNFLRALELAPSDPGVLTGLAYLHLESYQRGKGERFLDSSLAYSEEAMAVEPTYWKTPFTRAYIAFAVGDPYKSIELYNRAVDLNPDNSQIYSNLSAAEMCVDDYAGAKGTILAAQNRLGSDTLLLGNLGVANLDLGYYDDAVRQLKSAIDTQEPSGAVLYQLLANYGDALRQLGQTEDAKRAYDRSIEVLDRVVAERKEHPREKAARILYQSLALGLRTDQDIEFEKLSLQEALSTLQDDEGGEGTYFKAFVAQAWFALDKHELAEEVLASIDTNCPGFYKLPK